MFSRLVWRPGLKQRSPFQTARNEGKVGKGL
jgi:hypothetical protein